MRGGCESQGGGTWQSVMSNTVPPTLARLVAACACHSVIWMMQLWGAPRSASCSWVAAQQIAWCLPSVTLSIVPHVVSALASSSVTSSTCAGRDEVARL